VNYPLYLKLDNNIFVYGNYGASVVISGTVYSDRDLTSAVDLTGFTPIIRIHEMFSLVDKFGKTATITPDQTGSKGKFSYTTLLGDMTISPGVYECNLNLSKTGTDSLDTEPVKIIIEYGASS
jgi:hypothetical protein